MSCARRRPLFPPDVAAFKDWRVNRSVFLPMLALVVATHAASAADRTAARTPAPASATASAVVTKTPRFSVDLGGGRRASLETRVSVTDDGSVTRSRTFTVTPKESETGRAKGGSLTWRSDKTLRPDGSFTQSRDIRATSVSEKGRREVRMQSVKQTVDGAPAYRARELSYRADKAGAPGAAATRTHRWSSGKALREGAPHQRGDRSSESFAAPVRP
jgi:hypothetical protein